MLIFILLNIIAGWTAFLVVYKALKIKGFLDSLLALFVIYLAQIVLMELVLGISNTLYLKNIIIFTLAVFICTYLLTKNKRTSFESVNFGIYLNKLLGSKLYIFIFSVSASFLIVKLLVNLFNPPFGWDSLNYHFTFPVEWLKHTNLNTPITVFDDPSPTYYPLNGSLFYLWLIFPFKSVFLADLGQFPFFVVALISVYGIAGKIGLNKENAFYSAALFGLIPNFFKQLQIAYVDLMVGALFLVCVNYLLRLKKDFSFQNVFIYSLSLGLLIGTKTLALPYSLLLIIPLLVVIFENYKKSYLGIVVLVCALALGGFSYLRNFIETGNPLYPLDFILFNLHIFKGVMGQGAYSSHFIRADYSLTKVLFHEGLGAQTLLLVLPGIFLGLPLAFLKRRKSLDFNSVYFLLFPFLIYLVYRFVIPLANLRYLYALLGLGVILGFYISELLRIKKLVVNSVVAICIFASISELAKRQELVSSIIFALALFCLLVIFKGTKLFRSQRPLLIISLVLLSGVLFGAERFYNKNEFRRYPKMVKYSGFWPDATKAWDWLNNNTLGNNIAYAGRPVPFPLYGGSFKNNVYYVSVNKTEPAKLHYFKGGNYDWGGSYESLHRNLEKEGNYRENASYSEWMNNLRGKNTDYLFVYSLHQIKGIEFPIEDSWAKAHTESFELVFMNNTIRIYKVIK